MIQLTLQWIKTYAGSDSRFRSGFMLHQKQAIKGVEAGSRNSLHLTIQTPDQGDFTTSLYFYPDTGTFRYAKCTCHETQPCRHVIGGLLYVLYKKEALTETLTQNKTNKMYDSFESLLVSPTVGIADRHLSLEVILSPRDVFSKVQTTSVQLKVTFHSTYMIKHIENFVIAVIEGKSYEIAKPLKYESSKFIFDQTDMAIIQLFYDYYKTRNHLMNGQNSQVLTPLKASIQTLPGTYVLRLLTILEDHHFNIDYDGLYFKNQHIEERVEIDFYLTEDSPMYHVSVNTYDVYFPMTDNYTYVYYNNMVCRLTPREKEAFKLFNHYFSEKVMDIAIDQLEDFINKVKPILELIGYLHMDNTLSKRLETYPLTAELYIDKKESDLFLTLNYIYGPYTFNRYPESPSDTPDERLIVHNLEKERQIEHLLTSPSHHFEETGHLVYDSEEELYYFIDQQLPKLQQLCAVFYSDDFKNTYLKSQKQLVTHVNYNPLGNLLELDFEMADVSKEELYQLLSAVKEKKHYYKLRDGSFFTITDDLTYQVDALDHRFDMDFNHQEGPLIATSMANAFYMDLLLSQGGPKTDYSENFQKIIQDIRQSDAADISIPPVVVHVLRDYQKTGFKWLTALKSYGLGGILADDMGLGKTIQAITLFLSSPSTLPSIVVAPTSLIYNWEEEIHKFAPDIQTRVVVGTKTVRHALIQDIQDKEIIITSYGSLKRDLPTYDLRFEHCIIDEAQHIKNPRSQNAQAVKSINAVHRFALTGTPIENTLTELWSIFDFILPDYLNSHEQFVKTYERPIIKDNDTDLLARLTQLIQPFILRRLKEDVLTELPPKIETKVSVELNNHQKKLYMAYVQQAKADVSAYKDLPDGQKNMKILSVLTRLRQLCCHPALFVSDYKHSSSKLELLLELIEESIEGGHRVLVFSQFTSMLGLIKETLDKQNIDYFYLDGSVPPIKRQQMVHDFNTGINEVFLISLKAGGTGLNLTGADVVIHYDPWWNPAVENQATDRAYRIGQRNRVQVYKLITTGTIEEKIYKLQQRKMNLIDDVIKPGETFLNKLSVNELQSLFLED